MHIKCCQYVAAGKMPCLVVLAAERPTSPAACSAWHARPGLHKFCPKQTACPQHHANK